MPLFDDWYLVAHPNGPAIATTRFGFIGSIAHPCEDVPAAVLSAAVEAYLEASWPKVRDSFRYFS